MLFTIDIKISKALIIARIKIILWDRVIKRTSIYVFFNNTKIQKF